MATSYYFLGTSKSGFAKRERKNGLLMHALPYFLYLFYHFSLRSFFTLSFLLLSCRGLFPLFGLFFFQVPLFGCLLLSYYEFFPLGASAPLGPLLSVFFSLSCFSSFSTMITFLLQRTNSMGFLLFTHRASPTVFSLLWTSFQDYPPTHQLPLPLLSTCLLHRYSFHDKIPFCLFLLYTSTSLPSSMACIRWSQPFITSVG